MKDLSNFFSSSQKLRYAQSVCFMLLHSHGKSAHASQQQPRVKWCEHGTIQHVGPLEDLSRTVRCRDHGSRDDVAMPAQILGGGVDDDVDPMSDRLLKKRRCPAVVDTGQSAS